MLAEGSYGQVFLAASLQSQVDPEGNAMLCIDKPVAIKVFKYPEMPANSDEMLIRL